MRRLQNLAVLLAAVLTTLTLMSVWHISLELSKRNIKTVDIKS